MWWKKKKKKEEVKPVEQKPSEEPFNQDFPEPVKDNRITINFYGACDAGIEENSTGVFTEEQINDIRNNIGRDHIVRFADTSINLKYYRAVKVQKPVDTILKEAKKESGK